MSRFFNFLKYDFINTYSLNRLIKGDKKKNFYKLALGLFLSVYIIGFSFIFNNFLGKDLAKAGFGEYALAMSLSMSFGVIGIAGILKLAGAIFGGRDYNILGTMPINKIEIVIVKIINILIPTYILTLIFIIPSYIVYMQNAPYINGTFLIYGIIMSLFVPIIPTAIATLIGTVLMYVASKFKYKNIITIIIFLIFIIGVMIFPTVFGEDFLNGILKNSKSISDIFYSIYPPSKFYINALVNGSFLDMLIFIGISLAIFIAFVWVVNTVYLSINSKLLETSRKNNFKMKSLKENSVEKTLIQNEIKRYLGIPMVILNTCLGAVLFVIYSCATIFMGEKSIEVIFESNMYSDLKLGVIILVGAFCLLLTCTTSNTISLEGNKFWQLRALPIDTETIFKSKIMVNLLISVPSAIIGGILSSIGLGLTFIEGVCAIGLLIIICLFVSMGGLLVNLKFYTLTWTSEVAVVKRSASSMIMTFGGLALVFGAGFLFTQINISLNIYLMIITMFFVIADIIFFYLLKKWGVERFNQI